jgi:hypothetical protein
MNIARRLATIVLPLASVLAAAACEDKPPVAPPLPPTPPPTVASSAPPPPAAPAPVVVDTSNVPRKEWNRLAVELDMPLYWSLDTDANGKLDPAELAVVSPRRTPRSWHAKAETSARAIPKTRLVAPPS